MSENQQQNNIENTPTINEQKNLIRAQEIATIMQEEYKNKQELNLPIYDVDGNLYWPKQMTYEEVKKFVAERDKDKKEEDEK